MKLSEAIRIGSKMHSQAFGVTYVWDRVKGAHVIKESCVWGAAVAGGGCNEFVGATWPFIYAYDVSCPACECLPNDVHGTMIHLNDDHHWPREAIADWVEQFEEEVKSKTITVKEELHVQEPTVA